MPMPIPPADDALDPVAPAAELVRIPSVNPDLVPGAPGEGAVADHCARWLEAHGLEVHRLESHPGRPSVVGIARGSGGGRSLMLNGHLDTVTLEGYDGDPLDPRIDGDRLFGRGAYDMKSGVAAAMVAAVRASRQGLRGDVLVACVADEEHASFGTEEVLSRFRSDAAVVVEPSGLDLTVAHKGFVWFELEVSGRAAHGSRHDLGIDAITRAGHLLVAIEEWGERLLGGPRHPLLGTGSVHAGRIVGGEEVSSYPASCRVTIERRTVPGETGETVEAELREIVDRLSETVPGFACRIERGLERPPFAAPEGGIRATVQEHAERALGRPQAERGEPFWTDCALYAEAGIPCVMFGADGEGAHAATEWVSIESIRQLTDILSDVIADWCG